MNGLDSLTKQLEYPVSLKDLSNRVFQKISDQ